VNIPNALTLARIILVPLIVWLIITHEMAAAFVLFVLAGLSDAADGYLAKRFGWHTELGAYLDPIADKVLLVSIYLTLGFTNHLPVWLVIAVVSRDILIIGAFILSWILSRPVTVSPLLVSKACLPVSSWRSSASGSGLSRSWPYASGSRARLPSCLQPCISGYGSSTWRAMSLSLRSYRRARAIRNRSRPERVRGLGPRDPRSAHPRSAASRRSWCGGFPVQWIVPAVLLGLHQHHFSGSRLPLSGRQLLTSLPTCGRSPGRGEYGASSEEQCGGGKPITKGAINSCYREPGILPRAKLSVP
jgi:hypothetical protein